MKSIYSGMYLQERENNTLNTIFWWGGGGRGLGGKNVGQGKKEKNKHNVNCLFD